MDKVRVGVVGLGNMGRPLVNRLKKEGFPVAFSCSRKNLWRPDGSAEDINESSMLSYIDRYVKDVEVIFLAIPSGPHEMPLIKYCLDRDIYVVLFCKHALAYHYADLFAKRYMIGANATVGGRTMALPWVRMQYLEGRQFVLYAYLNASTNYYMQDAVDGGSALGSFEDAKDLRLAEPGSSDHVSFLNEEIGGDYPKKLSILMNDAVLGGESFITPDVFNYKALDHRDILSLTQPTTNFRYLIRIDNIGLKPEFDTEAPGSIYAEHGDFKVSGGFYDMSRDTHISRWMKGGKSNGVQVRFEGAHSYEGSSEIAGLGAGTATIGAAMNDLYEYQRARKGGLLEARWPQRSAA